MTDNDTTRRDFGTVYRRKGSRHWWIRYSVDGKRHYESSGSTKKRDAEKLLAKREVELGMGRRPEPEVRRTTFENLAKMIENDYVVNRRRSLRRLKQVLAHLREHFAGLKAASITTDRIGAYVRQRLEEGAASGTVQQELAALRRAFTLASRSGKVASIPHVPRLKLDNVRTGFLESGEYQGLLAELPDHLKPVLAFAFYTGWRKGEIVGLTWANVDFGQEIVRLEPGTTKNREGRSFPFGAMPELEKVLRTQREYTNEVERETGRIIRHVFHRGGQPIGDFRKAWASACVRAGLGQWQDPKRRQGYVGLIFHDLRRTAVRNLVRAGVPEKTAMVLTGHKTRSVFDRYDIVSERDLRDGVARLAEFHQGTKAERKTRVLAR